MWSHIVLGLSLHVSRGIRAQEVAAPLIFAPSKEWLGNDGPWSVFDLNIGTPAQRISVLPGSFASSVFAVVTEGCSEIDTNLTFNECAHIRGGLYAGNESTTLVPGSLYNTPYDPNLDGFWAFYGWDNVSLGGDGSGLPSVDHTLVSQIATKSLLLGLFGISPTPTNLANESESQPSFFSMLRGGEWIASRTWSYTAGSVNRGSSASLIFGGFDASQLDPTHSVSLPLYPDASRQLALEILSISTNISSMDSINLLEGSIWASINTAAAQIWLPLNACKAFEREFGLLWDETSQLYLVNDSLHASLVTKNPVVSFFVNGSTGPTNLTLSYNSFDLNVSWPYVGSDKDPKVTRRYFPLQRAANDTQYTLGRAFLQETYVIADYDRRNLNVSQKIFSDAASRVYTITPPSNDSATNSSNSNSASASASASASESGQTEAMAGGTIAGIVVGTVAALIPVYLCFAWAKKRWPYNKRHPTLSGMTDGHEKAELEGTTKPMAEAPADQQVVEMSGTGRPHESNAQIEKFELPGRMEEHAARHEMPAEVPVHESTSADQIQRIDNEHG